MVASDQSTACSRRTIIDCVQVRAGALAVVALIAASALIFSGGNAAKSSAAAPAAPPTVAPVLDTTTRKLTNCSRRSCFFRNWLVGKNQKLTVVLRDTANSAGPVQLTGGQLVLEGENTGGNRIIPAGSAANGQQATPTAPAVVTIDLDNDLHPDHYHGALLVQVDGADPVAANVDVQVRAEPGLPIAVLILTVIIGLALSLVISKRPAISFAKSATKLHVKIDNLPADERRILAPLFNETMKLRGVNFATAQSQLAALSAAVGALVVAHRIHASAWRQRGARAVPNWLQRVDSADTSLVGHILAYHASYDDDVALLEQARADLNTAVATKELVDELAQRAVNAPPGPDLTAFETDLSAYRTALSGASGDVATPAPDLLPLVRNVELSFARLPVDRPERRVEHVIEELGTEHAQARSAAPEGDRPDDDAVAAAIFDRGVALAAPFERLVPIVVWILLLAIGFKTTYLDNATFGASRSDWLTLIAWGIAAWGAKQSLTGLGKASSSS
jgi:hypothetical protein